MKTYHKIQTVFLKNPTNGFKSILDGQFSKEEFNFLKKNKWIWTEKIDGINIRILWKNGALSFRGKTDGAILPKQLDDKLKEKFKPDFFSNIFSETTGVCLYGEGYGVKIRKGGNYIQDDVDFILFDCLIDGWWLKRESLEDISNKFNINIVPIIGEGTLLEAIELVRNGFKSTIAQNKDYIAEGLIMKPAVEMFNRKGERIISKIKYKDFER